MQCQQSTKEHWTFAIKRKMLKKPITVGLCETLKADINDSTEKQHSSQLYVFTIFQHSVVGLCEMQT